MSYSSIWDILNSISPHNTLRLKTIPGRSARTSLYPLLQAVTHYSPPLFFLSLTKELAKADICARDRRALQQFALSVHVKHSDLT